MATVETAHGRVAGQRENGLDVFRGIPFARAPAGKLRWLPPRVPEPWSGVRTTTVAGPRSWQLRAPGGPLQGLMEHHVDNDEDCLSLNLWTPAADAAKRPVMVWIHGGAFTAGSGSQDIYDGQHLARRGDVVVVTLNYRLGALGFLNLDTLTNGRIPATGNEGLLDQVFALQWVRDNIAGFGGDPDNVTVFGESAGAMSIGALLGFGPARGLFRRAIAQSGAASTAYPLDKAADLADRLRRILGIARADDAAAWLAVSAEQLTLAGLELAVQTGNMAFQPVIDGTNMPALPLHSVAAGSADGVDLLVGATAHEWRLFTAMDPTAPGLGYEAIAARLPWRLGEAGSAGLIAAYREFADASGRDRDPASIFAALQTDRVFRIPGIRLAEALGARGQPVHQYLFTLESPLYGGSMRACHAIDIGPVWGTFDLNPDTVRFFGSGAPLALLTETVQEAWIAFARSGDPNTGRLDGWARYEPQRRCTALLGPGLPGPELPGPECTIRDAPLEAQRRCWDGFEDGVTVGWL